MREVRVVTARHWSRDAEVWRARVLRELGGLLFARSGELEIEVHIGPDPRLVRRDGGG